MNDPLGVKPILALTATVGSVTFAVSPEELQAILTVFLSALAGFGTLLARLYYIKRTGRMPGEKRDKGECNKDKDT